MQPEQVNQIADDVRACAYDQGLGDGVRKGIEYEMKWRWHRLMRRASEARNVFIAMHLQNAAIELWREYEMLPWKTHG